MGNSLREVKTRITATKNTAQITRAMNMVSASKLRKAEKVYNEYKDYTLNIEKIVKNVLSNTTESHPMISSRECKKICYIVITSDRGLAGSFNNMVYKKITEEINSNNYNNNDYLIGAIGRKGFSYCKKMKYNLVSDEAIFVRDDVDFLDIKNFATSLIDKYKNEEIDKIVVIYNKYINTITQEITTKQILPVLDIKAEKGSIDYEYEQGAEKTLDLLLPMYVETLLYGLILNAKTSEHAARMTAMKNATDNANDIINKLQIVYNRTRQAAITMELTDIIGGVNAVK